jgi:polysaccharide export outer membrane protein
MGSDGSKFKLRRRGEVACEVLLRTSKSTCSDSRLLGKIMVRRSIEKRNEWSLGAVRSSAVGSYLMMAKSTGAIGALAALFMVLCAGCQTDTKASLPEQPTAKTPVNLAPGDVIRLSFAGAPDFNQSQKIRADGKVSLPLIGEVTASGKTVPQFQNELVQLYKPQLRNSDVIVTLESAVAQVIVSGAVTKPAKLTFERPTTILQAIMEAGGVSEFGTLRRVHLIRIVHGEELTQVLDLRPTLAGKATNPLYVRDGDVIYVPQSMF